MSQSERSTPGKCPVCNARFRGSATCSRCGTDLALLMRAAGSSWLLRKAAREALLNADLMRAFALCSGAERLSSSPSAVPDRPMPQPTAV